jgi:hypothetical protein
MKKIHLLFLFLNSFFLIMGQNEAGRCMSMEYLKHQFNAYLNGINFYATEKKAMEWEKIYKNEVLRMNQNIITIPVVFHVVYKNNAQNIPDSLIHSQIQVLNECFRKQNANYINTRPIFDSLGADVQIEFCLASTDPNGNPTTGIVRKQAPSNAQFNPLFGFDNVKKPSKGGDTLWPPDRYLNIWTCDMSLLGIEAVLGYAQFPGMTPETDGVVIQYNYVGKYAKPGFLGRTTVHEVGHWLGLRHIWADDDLGSNPSSKYCDSTDYVDDTPNQGPRSNSNCNYSAVTCTNESAFWGSINPPDMIENYMDYSRDSCMTLFTKGQKARMYGFLNTDPIRIAIKTSTAGCNPLLINSEIPASDRFIQIYPNPANSHFKIKNSGGLIVENVCVNNTGGKRVKEFISSTDIFDVNELHSGIYFVRIKTNKGLIVKKLIKE